MKAPIEVVGETVRTNDGTTPVRVIAYVDQPSYLVEYEDGTRWLRQASSFEFTLPPELPTDDHHIGWLTAPGTELAREDVLGEWFFGDEPKITSSGFNGVPRSKVTRWIPATAVPTAALDELRTYFNCITPSSVLTTSDFGKVLTFLAAVDAANGTNP